VAFQFLGILEVEICNSGFKAITGNADHCLLGSSVLVEILEI
jgi:hypothetical protein